MHYVAHLQLQTQRPKWVPDSSGSWIKTCLCVCLVCLVDAPVNFRWPNALSSISVTNGVANCCPTSQPDIKINPTRANLLASCCQRLEQEQLETRACCSRSAAFRTSNCTNKRNIIMVYQDDAYQHPIWRFRNQLNMHCQNYEHMAINVAIGMCSEQDPRSINRSRHGRSDACPDGLHVEISRTLGLSKSYTIVLIDCKLG